MSHAYYERPSALYRVYDENDHLLYIGCSPAPLTRLKDHEALRQWATRMRRVTVEWFPDRWTANEAEAAAIRDEKPEWNVHFNLALRHAHRPKPYVANRGAA